MKIVFVCTGNASRSAVAEVILRKMIQEKNLEDMRTLRCRHVEQMFHTDKNVKESCVK